MGVVWAETLWLQMAMAKITSVINSGGNTLRTDRPSCLNIGCDRSRVGWCCAGPHGESSVDPGEDFSLARNRGKRGARVCVNLDVGPTRSV